MVVCYTLYFLITPLWHLIKKCQKFSAWPLPGQGHKHVANEHDLRVTIGAQFHQQRAPQAHFAIESVTSAFLTRGNSHPHHGKLFLRSLLFATITSCFPYHTALSHVYQIGTNRAFHLEASETPLLRQISVHLLHHPPDYEQTFYFHDRSLHRGVRRAWLTGPSHFAGSSDRHEQEYE